MIGKYICFTAVSACSHMFPHVPTTYLVFTCCLPKGNLPCYKMRLGFYMLSSNGQIPLLQNTTLYYKACTKHFPVLLCTTQLAQSTSQYYFVLQSLHKALPSTTVYYKACTKHFPVLLCIQALPNATLYHFVQQLA